MISVSIIIETQQLAMIYSYLEFRAVHFSYFDLSSNGIYEYESLRV